MSKLHLKIRCLRQALPKARPRDHARIFKGIRKALDQITREQTAFSSFDDLMNANGGYVPSIEVSRDEGYLDRLELANAYDKHMEDNRDPRRAYRYGMNVDNQAFNTYRLHVRQEARQ